MITDQDKFDSLSGTTEASLPPAASDAAPELLDRVVQSAHDTIDRLAETAAPHVQRLAEGFDSASATVHERADSLRQTGDEWAEQLRDTVRTNPLTAVAAALAIGLIVARLTR